MHGNYIDGEWQAARGGRTTPNRNPAHIDMILGEFPDSTAADVADAVAAATAALPAWRALPMPRRGEILHRAAELLNKHMPAVAETITREQGKTLREARGEVSWSTGILRYYAGEALQPYGEVYPPSTPDTLLYTRREPLGVVGVITPWNYPLSIPAWKIAPALVYGNTVVFKPAELTPQSAALLVSVLDEAGLPPGVLNLVHGRGPVVGEAIVGHQQLAGISFTGSNEIGRSIKRRLVERNTRLQLELGGKNPLIVLHDADLDKAVRWTISGAMRMAGQKCTATSRVIVEEPVLAEFTLRLVDQVRRLRVGDGLDPDTYVGPLISETQQAKVLDYVHLGIREGAEVLTGGDALEEGGYEEGYFVAPTVFGAVQPGMRIMQEEIFGPVVGVIGARNTAHAIEIANAVPFGLTASLITRDLSAALHYVDAIAAGVVHVNRESSAMDFYAPFGGMKTSSSHSRELGKAARDFFTETKTIYLQGLSGS
jgi:alpha-ketoglutaric semialdehyde dehydrogenase